MEDVLLEAGDGSPHISPNPKHYSEYKMLNSAKTVELLSIKGNSDPSFDRNRTMADTQPINSHRILRVLHIDECSKLLKCF